MEAEKYRHELKFLSSRGELLLLENRIRHICRPDGHVGKEGSYRIRSLYFDTYDDSCYYENEAGADDRRKYRIRIYNGNPDEIKLECKETLHGMKRKEICRLTGQQCRQLMQKQPVTEVQAGQELLERFLVERSTRLFEPKVIVEYTRAPYVHPAGNVRITFDRQIASSYRIEEFLEPVIPCRSILAQGQEILEVKYDEGLPGAIRELVTAGQQLRQISFSKYALCRKYSMR